MSSNNPLSDNFSVGTVVDNDDIFVQSFYELNRLLYF